MRFMETDGGRAFSKRPKQANDCAVVATATLLRLPYDVVFDEMKRRGRKNNAGFYFPHGSADGPGHGELLGHWFEITLMEPTPLGRVASALPDCLACVTINNRDHLCAVRGGVVWDFHKKSVLINAGISGFWTAKKIRA